MRGGWPSKRNVLLLSVLADLWIFAAAIGTRTGHPTTHTSLLQVSLNISKIGGTVSSEVKQFNSRLGALGRSIRSWVQRTVPSLDPNWTADFVDDEAPEHDSPAESAHHGTEPTHGAAGPSPLGKPSRILGHESHTGPGVEHAHRGGYLALAFLLGGLFLGSLLQMMQERFLQKIPYTCLLFLLGIIFSLIHHFRPSEHWTTWPTWFMSVDLWEEIDPHLVFYVFLPVLIFVEAMRLNVKLATKCFSQVMVLACPGVVFGTFVTGAFAKACFPYSWNWPTALIFGSILSATDPVAVVSLFQTLGVSPRLTMVISGESLLNDGTAIVLFELMLKILMGNTITFGSTVVFLIRMAVISCILGVFLAFCALAVISWCAESNYHTDAMIQVIVTVGLSFLCFFLAESECETSGVLTVVSAGCIFSYVAWPRFVSKETMRTVWEALEFVGNTLIFLLAGLLFGHKCLSRTTALHWVDFGWLILLYVVVTVIRAVMVILFWPVLNLVGARLSWQEGLVMVWSGLRGAVGLVLAIILDLEPDISTTHGSQIIFHVGGIAMLTILINSTTCGPLLKALDMTKAPEIEDQTTAHLAKLTDEHAQASLETIVLSDDVRFQGANIETVKTLVPSLAHCVDVAHDLAQGKKGIDIASKLRMYREIFMRTVQRHYWTDIEEGMIPKNSRIARILLYSTDEALVNANKSLCDWDTIVENIDHNFRPLQRICNAWPLRLITPLQQWFPSANTVAMWKVYAGLSFMQAHQAAQAEVPAHFGSQSVLTPRVQEQVNRESIVQCEKAAALLKTIPESLIAMGKNRMLAGKMLQLQLQKIVALQDEGILPERGASHLSHHIHEVQRVVVGFAVAGKVVADKSSTESAEEEDSGY